MTHRGIESNMEIIIFPVIGSSWNNFQAEIAMPVQCLKLSGSFILHWLQLFKAVQLNYNP